MKRTIASIIIAAVLMAWGAGEAAAQPQLTFVGSTPADGETVVGSSVEIEVDIVEPALASVTFNWAGTDYTIYDDSLVLMFNFDNVDALEEDYSTLGGLVKDLSSWGNDGSVGIDNDPTSVPEWLSNGRYGGALDFAGNGSTFGQSILVIPNDSSLNPDDGDFAIAVWVRPRDDIDGDILRKGSTNTASTWYKLEHSPSPSNNRFSLNFNTDGTDATVTSPQAYNDDQWHFVLAQRRGGTAELWIDGSIVGSVSVSGSISNSANLTVGSKDDQNDDFINATLDEVRIYMRSFTEAEIVQLYMSNLSKTGTDQWTLYSQKAGLTDGTYTYSVSATNSTAEKTIAQRSVTVQTGSVPSVGSYNIYYGFLHNHSNLSDGTGTPATAYEYSKYVSGLDFFSLSDHGYYLDTGEYQSVAAVADSYNEAGVFTAFWGFEWTHSTTYGHITVINSADHCDRSNPDTFAGLMDWLDSRDCVAFFNHPGRGAPVATEFENFLGARSDKMVGIELWNKDLLFGTYYYNDGYATNTTDRSGYFDEALLNGWRIGAAGSEDNHSGDWGYSNNRLAVLANANTRAELYAALQARRFYSTLDKNLALSFEIDGQVMGSQIEGGSNTGVIEAADGDGESFSQIELIHNGNIVQTWSSSDFNPAHPVVNFNLTTGQGDYIYCKVTQADGGEAISSPVFVVIDGPPQADLIVPQDNGPDDLEPAQDQVLVNTNQSNFQIQLTDVDGINDSSVTSDTVSITGLNSGSDYYFDYDAEADVIILTAPTVFGDGAYEIVLSGGAAQIRDSLGNLMVPTILTVVIDTSIVPPETLSFQQDVGSYLGVADTMLRGASADTQYSSQAIITVDGDDGGWPSQVLLRFDDIIGGAADQIPTGAVISSAALRLRSLDSGNGGRLHAMLVSWVDTSTWNDLGNGIQADGVEAKSDADDDITSNSLGTDVDLDVTATVQGWVDGIMVNNGWVVLPNSGTTDGWDIASSEHGTLDYRPELTVTFTASGERPPVADAGPDQAVTDSDENGEEVVILDASGSYHPDAPDAWITLYEWDTDGNGTTDLTGETVNTTFGIGTYTVTLTVTDNRGSKDSDNVTITINTGYVEDVANNDIPVRGTITGNYTDTQISDNNYEIITERESGGKPSDRYSYLEHKWTINVTGGNTVTFYVEAYKSDSVDGDDFVFAYSTDDSSYTDMLTVTKTSDDNTSQSCPLPPSISGTVYIRVIDTDQTQGNKSLDTINIDNMYVRSRAAGEPDTDPPIPDPMTWATVPYSTGSASIAMVATTASDASGVEYYFACTAGGGNDSGWQDSATYEDTGLLAGVEYTYQVKARDKSANQNETDWSIPESATPVDMPPEAPTGLVATPGDTQVSLDWDDNPESDIAGYNVYRSGASGGPYTYIGTPGLTSDYLDLTVDNGTTYYYVVTAVDASNESAYSSEVSATPDSQQIVYVDSITVSVGQAGKKYYATATIQINPDSGGATIVGDWYFKGTLRLSGATGVTGTNGIAELTSFETPAKSGDTFTFMVTDVILSGYVYDPSQGVTEGSNTVP